MSAVEVIATAARAAGYRQEAIVRNYAFADVMDASATTRRVPLVAFTRTPPSYRTAALGVLFSNGVDAFKFIQEHRALGAPLLFSIDGEDVTIWQTRSVGPPRTLERAKVCDIPEIFERKRDIWNPDAIHRAKSIGAIAKNYQLDFVDVGLLPAIEGEIHAKLDRLLVDTLTAATEIQDSPGLDIRLLFRVVFRLLTAKVLQDRGHPYAADWDADNLTSILKAIESYYSLETMAILQHKKAPMRFQVAWDCLRQGINFSNISADDLAFVYENTLVTPEARKLFGTHSTPHQLAEYIVQRLELHRHRPEVLRVYEPFAGSGTFLVSALRHVRDLLPTDWDDQQRHDFMIDRLYGDEVDPFACEVACLSLILADYPSHNGWHISEIDLFEGSALAERMSASNVILCNPPFESFTIEERKRYQVAAETHSKPIAVLEAALNARPLALGFVLPKSFILDRQYRDQRRKVERQYSSIEVVRLPDRTFGASVVETALLIAKERRSPKTTITQLKSTEIADRDRSAFLRTGKTSTQRVLTREATDELAGTLWIPAHSALWRYTSDYPRLGSRLKPSVGLQWTYRQAEAFSDSPRRGFQRGLHSARGLQQFMLKPSVWLDYRREFVRRGYGQKWQQPKLIMNAARVSRGPWRVAAALDKSGLLHSQQFFGLWPKSQVSTQELLALAAIMNGPLANAFIAIHSPAKRLRANAIAQVPIPPAIPGNLGVLVEAYATCLARSNSLQVNDDGLNDMLAEIDALVLEAYDLPPRLEFELLDYFSGSERPVVHNWVHWDIAKPGSGLRLAERMSGRYKSPNRWISDVFQPLPASEAALLRKFGA